VLGTYDNGPVILSISKSFREPVPLVKIGYIVVPLLSFVTVITVLFPLP
jgi:hypothetical protein